MIKFNYSTKNDTNPANKKGYSQKFAEDRFDDYSPKKGYNRGYRNDRNYNDRNDRNDRNNRNYEEKDKKKVKYVAKDSDNKKKIEEEKKVVDKKDKPNNSKKEKVFNDPNNPFSVFA